MQTRLKKTKQNKSLLRSPICGCANVTWKSSNIYQVFFWHLENLALKFNVPRFISGCTTWLTTVIPIAKGRRIKPNSFFPFCLSFFFLSKRKWPSNPNSKDKDVYYWDMHGSILMKVSHQRFDIKVYLLNRLDNERRPSAFSYQNLLCW